MNLKQMKCRDNCSVHVISDCETKVESENCIRNISCHRFVQQQKKSSLMLLISMK